MRIAKVVGLGLLCFLVLSLGNAEAGIRDQFERFSGFGGLSSAFERLTGSNKPTLSGQGDGYTSAFSKLANINKLSETGLKASFTKLGSVDPTMGRVVLKPSFERIATTTLDMKSALKSNLERMAKVDMGITGDLRPSFSKLDSLSLSMQGELKPSFAKLASLGSPLTGELKPSFEKMATLSSGLSGDLRPSFARLATISSALTGQLNSSFSQLGNLSSATTLYLKPSFMKLASISPAFSGALNPSFAKLVSVNPALSGSLSPAFSKLVSMSPAFSGNLNPAFSRLGTFSPKFMPQGINHTFGMRKEPSLKEMELASKQRVNFHIIPADSQFKGVKVQKPRKSISLLEQFFGGPGSLYRLSLNPQELKGVSSDEAAKILQKDIHLIQPQLMNPNSTSLSYEATPQNVSLISLLGIEKVQ